MFFLLYKILTIKQKMISSLFQINYKGLNWPQKLKVSTGGPSMIAKLSRTKRWPRSTMGKKMKYCMSTPPRKFGNHVTVRLPDRPSTPQAYQYKINRYGNLDAIRSYFGGKSHSHGRLVNQRQLKSRKDENGKRKLLSKVSSLD